MSLPYSRLSCSVLRFLCMPCLHMAILYCLRRVCICCVDDLTINLTISPLQSLLFRCTYCLCDFEITDGSWLRTSAQCVSCAPLIKFSFAHLLFIWYIYVAPYFRNRLLKEMWHFGSFRVCSRACMSLTLSATPRPNGFDVHSQWGLRQMAVGLMRKLQLGVKSWPLVQKLWKFYQ